MKSKDKAAMKKKDKAAMKKKDKAAMKKLAPGPASRVKIAKDVIAQINAKKYQGMEGVWVGVKRGKGHDILGDVIADARNEGANSESVLCSIVDSNPKCNVCALGGIFMSTLRVTGDCDFRTAGINIESRVFECLSSSPLTRYFPRSMLILMEACFEGNMSVHYFPENNRRSHRNGIVAEYYRDRFLRGTDRLRAIARNIVRNKGDFKPEQDLTASIRKEIESAFNTRTEALHE